MRDKVLDNFYYKDIDSEEPVRTMYTVTLVVPATLVGEYVVEAGSSDEALALALGEKAHEVNWGDADWDHHAVQVLDVECEDPAVNTVLIQPGHSSVPGRLRGCFEFDGEAPTSDNGAGARI